MRLYLSSFRLGNKPEELIKLLGNKKKTALIMNAKDFIDGSERDEDLRQESERLRSIGLEPIDVDLREYFDKPDQLKDRLAQFDLIWVRGGNVFILRRAFEYSGANKAIKELLDEDRVVYGGYSAGIDVLTPSLKGIEFVDDPHIVPEGYKSEVIWDCLGILSYAVTPHYKSDHPESADIDKSVEWYIDNHILFKALRDGEAIVINGASERVVS